MACFDKKKESKKRMKEPNNFSLKPAESDNLDGYWSFFSLGEGCSFIPQDQEFQTPFVSD